jgi:hypothetical protein
MVERLMKRHYYRAWVTDLRRTVVLGFPERTIVLSPDNPEEFVSLLSEARSSRQDGAAF